MLTKKVSELHEAYRKVLHQLGYKKQKVILTNPLNNGSILRWQSGWQDGSRIQYYCCCNSATTPMEIHGQHEANHPNDPFKQCREWAIDKTCWVIVKVGVFCGKDAMAVITPINQSGDI